MASTTDKFSTARKDKDFTLYSHTSGPNGWKISHVFEELGLEYETIFLDFMKGEHKGPGIVPLDFPQLIIEYAKINPNGRIPAIIDHKRNDFVLWESGAILLYLVKHYDPEYKLWSKDEDEQALINQWLFYQVSGLGPYAGQAFWYVPYCLPLIARFSFYHKEKLPSAVERYVEEVKRILGVLEGHLSKPENKGWLAAGKFTIADLSYISWLTLCEKLPIKYADYPAFNKWYTSLNERPAIINGWKGGPYERK
jgi:glutathione S-transferase